MENASTGVIYPWTVAIGAVSKLLGKLADDIGFFSSSEQKIIAACMYQKSNDRARDGKRAYTVVDPILGSN